MYVTCYQMDVLYAVCMLYVILKNDSASFDALTLIFISSDLLHLSHLNHLHQFGHHLFFLLLLISPSDRYLQPAKHLASSTAFRSTLNGWSGCGVIKLVLLLLLLLLLRLSSNCPPKLGLRPPASSPLSWFLCLYFLSIPSRCGC